MVIFIVDSEVREKNLILTVVCKYGASRVDLKIVIASFEIQIKVLIALKKTYWAECDA